MTDTSTAPQPDVRPRGLPSRVLGVIFSPADTFRSVAARPRWLGVMALVIGVSGALWFWFAGTDVGQQAMLDQQIQRTQSMGGTVTDEQYAAFQRMMPMMKYFVVGSQVVAGPVITLILAGILYAVFTAGLGGAARFKQVFAVLAHSGVITVLQTLFTIPINYARESMASATNLAVLLPMLDEGSFLARLLGVIDLFIVWWLLVLAIGIGVLYRRRTAPIFSSFVGIYAVIAVVVAIVMSMAGGSQ
jgi:hypothetical protein